MALDFPPGPTFGQIYTSDSGRSWQWNGTAWDVYSITSANVVNFLNGLTGGVTLSAGTGITLSPFGNILTISSTESGISGPYVVSIRGLTGAVGITNGSGIGLSVSGNTLNISNAGVLSFNGFTGAVQGVSAALGTTFLSVSSATGSVTFTNLGVQTFNGLTGTVTGVTLGGAAFTGLVSSTVGFSGPGTNITGVVTSFNNQTGAVTGVTLGGAAFTGLVSSTVGFSGPGTNITGVVTSFNNQTGAVQGVSTFNGLTGSIGFSAGTGITLTQSGNTFTIVATGVSGVSSVTGSGTGISVSPTTGAVVVQNTGVISFNGLTGTVTGVASATGGSGILITPSGGTGNITVTNTGVTGIQGGTGISVSSTTGNPTITNTGVQSLTLTQGNGITVTGSGTTGALSYTVTNAGVTGVQAGSFISVTSTTGNPTINNIGVQTFNGATGAVQGVNVISQGPGISISPSGGTGNVTITNTGVTAINGFTGSISNVAFTNQGNTFSVTQILNAGLSASGITVGGSIVLQNREFIRNTTDGRIDFMPGPISGPTFGLYMDFTNWGPGGEYGVKLGTIRASDNALNVAGILYDTDLVMTAGKYFSQNSSGTLKFIASGINDNNVNTLQITLPSAAGSTANALVLMDNTSTGYNTTRVPSFAVGGFTNPNFFIYSGVGVRANANDYLRFEHNITNGRIISGGTSGISIEPGSGVLGISGGISATGGTFANDIRVNSMTIGRGTGNISSNIAFGEEAYRDGTTGSRNVAIGSGALRVNKAGDLNTAIGSEALRSNINGRNNIAIGRDSLFSLNSNTYGAGLAEYNVAIGGNALGAVTTANNNTAVGNGAAQQLTTGGNNIAIGTFTLQKCGAGNDNIAIGVQAMVGGAGASITTPSQNVAIGVNSLAGICNGGYNTAIGTEALLSLSTAFFTTAIGASALRNITTSENSVAIGFDAARFISDGVTNKTAASNCVYIGTSSKSGAADTTNEIVIGHNAVGLGTNTTVIGKAATTSATIYGTLNAPSGISAAGGTFTGTLNLNGQTFRNLVSSVNGFTGAIGSVQNPPGQTSGAVPVVSYPSGITHYGTGIPFYLPLQLTQNAAGTGAVWPNRVYFTVFNTPKPANLHTLKFTHFSGVTGNCIFGVYDVNPDNGLPRNLLYSSTSITITASASNSVTNASGLLTVPAGNFYIAAVFNNTPTLFALPGQMMPIYGSKASTSGYVNFSPFADTTGFTLPTALPSPGLTFGFIDYVGSSAAITGIFFEYRIV